MERIKNTLITLLLVLPATALAHGEEVLILLFIDVTVILTLLVFIGFLKWKIKGKLLLLLTLIITLFFTFTVLGSMPYRKNAVMINTLSAVIPVLSVLAVFLLFRKKFVKQT